MWDFNNPKQSEATFKDLLEISPEHQTEILSQIARAQGLQGNFEEAHTTLNEGERLSKDERVTVRYLLRAWTNL